MSSLLRIAAFAGLGGFLFGYDLGLIAGALLYMDTDEDLHLTTASSEAIVGMAKLGAVFGTFIGGALMADVGRKRAIAVTGVFFLLGPFAMAVSADAVGLALGRLIVGLGVGASAVCVPAYVAEMAPPENRGALVVTYELMLCFGMLFSGVADYALRDAGENNWRFMVAAPAVPAVAMVLGIYVLPESPRWLVVRGRLRDALRILHGVREGADVPFRAESDASTARVEAELMELWSAVEKERDAKASRNETATNLATRDRNGLDRNGVTLNDTTEPWNHRIRTALAGNGGFLRRRERRRERRRRRRFVGTNKKKRIDRFVLGGARRRRARRRVFAGPAVRGLEAVPGRRVFGVLQPGDVLDVRGELRAAGAANVGMESKDDAVLFASFVSAAKLAGVAASMFAVDRVGRKPLLVVGSFGSGVAMVFLSVAYAARSAALVVAAMCAFMFAFSASWAGVFWVIVSELFTMRWKAPAMSAATALLFATGACVDFVFLSAAETFGAGAFALIALVCLAAGVYAARAVPETKGKTLAEIQRAFRDGSFDDARDGGGRREIRLRVVFRVEKKRGAREVRRHDVSGSVRFGRTARRGRRGEISSESLERS
jgi:MFS family permease